MNKLKLALYAASEGGKTLQIGNLISAFGSHNVGIISCEGGLNTIASKVDPAYIKECANLDDVRAAWAWAQKTFTKPVQFVCVDGGSRVLQWVRDDNWGGAEACMEALLEGRRREQLPESIKSYARFVTKDGSLDGQRIWIQVGTECERLFDAFIKLPCSVVWNFWEELTNTDQYSKNLPWKPDTPGNGAFNAINNAVRNRARLRVAPADGQPLGGAAVPACRARIQRVDFKGQGFKSTDWALASLGVMVKLGLVIRPQMLEDALAARLKGDALTGAQEIVRRAEPGE